MQTTAPAGEVDERYSSPGVAPTAWADAQQELEAAEIYWLSSVRPDGRPHVTPLIAVWLDGAMHFCTGPDESKARNIEQNARCILTTGCNKYGEGLDVIVEGEAVRLGDEARLQRLADAYVAKYGEEWRFEVRDSGFFHNDGGQAIVFEVKPVKVFGFKRGEPGGQTRWRF